MSWSIAATTNAPTTSRSVPNVGTIDERGRWLQDSGSPSPGRPVSSRQKISEKLLADLAVVWEEHGARAGVLQRLAVTDPGKLAQIPYGLLPRDVFISVEQRTPGNLDPDEWAILRRVSISSR
jgi:hypothetical protein